MTTAAAWDRMTSARGIISQDDAPRLFIHSRTGWPARVVFGRFHLPVETGPTQTYRARIFKGVGNDGSQSLMSFELSDASKPRSVNVFVIKNAI